MAMAWHAVPDVEIVNANNRQFEAIGRMPLFNDIRGASAGENP
jgi:hypothetical protein